MKLDFISWHRQTECCVTRRAGRSIRDSKASRSVPWRSPCWAATVGRKMLSPSGRAIPETNVLLSGGELPSCVSGSHVNQSFLDSRRSLCGISAHYYTTSAKCYDVLDPLSVSSIEAMELSSLHVVLGNQWPPLPLSADIIQASSCLWTLGLPWDLDDHIKEGASYEFSSIGIELRIHPKCGKTIVIRDSWNRD